MENNPIIANTDDFAFDSEEISAGALQKLQSAINGNAGKELKAFAANVLIGNIPTKSVNEHIGDVFRLCGFNVKNFKYKGSGRDGKYTVMFGYDKSDKPCAYNSTSEKIHEAIMKILCVYGDVSDWNGGISVRIRMNTADGVKAYSLEVV